MPTSYHHRKLPHPPAGTEAGGQHFWALLSGSEPPDDLSFKSDHLQVVYNMTSTPWQDPAAHAHAVSDEIYIVLEGGMTVTVDDVRVEVAAGESLCIPAGTFHQLVDVNVPLRSFVVRAPSVKDKVTTRSQ